MEPKWHTKLDWCPKQLYEKEYLNVSTFLIDLMTCGYQMNETLIKNVKEHGATNNIPYK